MQTIQIQLNDSYVEKFLNLLQALPQNEIKILDKDFERDRQMFRGVLEDYKNDKEKFEPYEKGMDELNSWLDNLVK